VEQGLITDQSAFAVSGHCFVCGQRVDFHVDFSYCSFINGERTPNWREHLSCPGCGLNNRMRAAIHILEQAYRPRQTSRLYATEQTTPLFRALRARYPRLIGSEYLGSALPFGTTNAKGIRNESITHLRFPSSAFDHILSFDVLEHVPDYLKGFSECFRCLKPGGTLLFSVPFTGEPDNLVRAQVNANGTISHLLPPEYHGDPLNAQGCLCFYHFGWELLDSLRGIGFRDVFAFRYWSREFGYLGNGEQLMFTAQRPPAH
jgi:SAM-dependent methyltransferase